MAKSELTVKFTYVSLDCWREPENLENLENPHKGLEKNKGLEENLEPLVEPSSFITIMFESVIKIFVSLFFSFSDRYVLVGSRHDSDRGGGTSAIMNQLIAALTEQTKRGWVPDRTTVFCSWGGSALGNIGSHEWGKVSECESFGFVPTSSERPRSTEHFSLC